MRAYLSAARTAPHELSHKNLANRAYSTVCACGITAKSGNFARGLRSRKIKSAVESLCTKLRTQGGSTPFEVVSAPPDEVTSNVEYSDSGFANEKIFVVKIRLYYDIPA